MICIGLIVFLALLSPCRAMSAVDPVLYTDKELWAIGNLWKQTEVAWDAEMQAYRDNLAQIENSPMSETRKKYFMQREVSRHRAVSQELGRKRHQVHQAVLNESSARAGNSRSILRQRIDASLGTSIDDRAHRGLMGDLDAAGGAVAVDNVESVLQDMGLDHLTVTDSPATLEVGAPTPWGDDPFDLTVHKQGLPAQVGSEYHRIQIENHARNHEVFVSASMRDPVTGKTRAGAGYVEVQDHLKKASGGLNSSSGDLAGNPELMQPMAKSVDKTLRVSELPDEELGSILERHGIRESPQEFRRKLNNIKEARTVVSDPSEAGRMRQAAAEIFDSAESRTLQRANQELRAREDALRRIDENMRRLDNVSDTEATRLRKERLRQSYQQRQSALRQEITDSRARMQATAAANGRKPVIELTGPETPAGPTRMQQLGSGARRAAQVYGTVTDFTDIGHLGQTLEDYMEGDASLFDVARQGLRVPPLSATPVGMVAGGAETIVGTSKRMGQSIVDARDAHLTIRQANENNLAAYLTQWEIRFRRAGMDPGEARAYVAASVEAGNLDVLEARAEALRAAGAEIESPELVIEDGIGPDGGKLYMLYNLGDVVYGMGESVYSGAAYTIRAPGRIVESWAEGELAEAVLEYDSRTAEADMRVQMFRALRNAGIERDKALQAVNEGGSFMRSVFQEARELQEQARLEQERLEAEILDLEQRINRILSEINRLRWMDITVHTTPPSPMNIPYDPDADEDMVFEVEISLGGGFQNTVNRIRHGIRDAAGQDPDVSVTYEISLPGAQETEPGQWLAEIPAVPEAYPFLVDIEVNISGLDGHFSFMQRTVRRQTGDVLLLLAAEEKIEFQESQYSFTDGDYEPVHAVVSNLNPDSTYYYYWTFMEQDGITEIPAWKLHAILEDSEEPQSFTATVSLADIRTGLLLDEDQAMVHVHPVEILEETITMDLFENRTYWTTATPFANDPTVRFPEATIIATPGISGIQEEISEYSSDWERLQEMLHPRESVEDIMKQHMQAELEKMGMELSEAQMAQALQMAGGLTGLAGEQGIEPPDLLGSGYVYPGEPVELDLTVSVPMPPRFRVMFPSPQGAASLDAEVRVKHWMLSTGFMYSPRVRGNNAATSISWVPEPDEHTESFSLELITNYSIDFFKAGTDEPLVEDGIPLRYDPMTTYFTLGFFFLPLKEPPGTLETD